MHQFKFKKLSAPKDNKPDPYTKNAPGLDYTDPTNSAEKRILFIDLGFLRYGTEDKAHAAAVIFSSVLLLILVLLTLILMNIGDAESCKTETLKYIFEWIKSAFMLTIGVAIGTRSEPKDK